LGIGDWGLGKFKFYYKNVDLGKKNLDINNKKKLMKKK